MGLGGLEAFHSDHTADEAEYYLALARKHGLAVDGRFGFPRRPETRAAAGQRL